MGHQLPYNQSWDWLFVSGDSPLDDGMFSDSAFGDSPFTADTIRTNPVVGSCQEQSMMCLFPTSVAKPHDQSQKDHTTSFLKGHSYSFGCLDVGSLDIGPQKNLYTTRHTGAFRSEGVWGNGYFARELLEGLSEFPHYLPTEGFRQRRDDLILTHAGNLVKLPKEIRLMIYDLCCLPLAPHTLPSRSFTSAMKPCDAMLLNLQTTCSFLHEEVSTYLYSHHIYYFNTPARLANFTRCLSFGPVSGPLNLGTIILEIRKFDLLRGIEDLDRLVVFRSPLTVDRHVSERDYTLCEPHEKFKDHRMTNPHFVHMRGREGEVTRKWSSCRHEIDWVTAIRGLVKHKVQKLVIKVEPGDFAAWRSGGRLLKTLEFVGESEMVGDVDVVLEGEEGQEVPHQVAARITSLKGQYGWN